MLREYLGFHGGHSRDTSSLKEFKGRKGSRGYRELHVNERGSLEY